MILTINEIIKRFRTEGQCYKFKPQTITYMASKLGYTKKRFGGKIGYDQSLITAITRHFNEAVDYDKGLGMKVPQKPLKQPNMGDYYTYNGERDNVDYDWEKNESFIIRKAIIESINELDLYHGTQAEFSEFDLAYLGSGWGQQVYGYGVYLIDNPQGANEYSKGGYIYTVKVPNSPYLSYKSISRASAMKIAKDFFKYYTTENEYGKEAYKGYEREFWNEECKYLCDCQTGGDIYGTIASLLGDDKETSAFLYREGYKGIKWIDVTANGTKNTNYVVFNQKDIKIIKKKKVE